VLRLRTPSGSIEALPHQEARVRALTTAALIHELQRPQPDIFALAEAIDREVLAYHSVHGWYLTGAARRH
jgi:hypothetical protein